MKEMEGVGAARVAVDMNRAAIAINTIHHIAVVIIPLHRIIMRMNEEDDVKVEIGIEIESEIGSLAGMMRNIVVAEEEDMKKREVPSHRLITTVEVTVVLLEEQVRVREDITLLGGAKVGKIVVASRLITGTEKKVLVLEVVRRLVGGGEKKKTSLLRGQAAERAVRVRKLDLVGFSD